ncbi:MAG: tetratricopeptide repeat protein [Pseudonocardiaceae bacterium]
MGLTNTAHSLGETRLALPDVDGARIDYDQALRISQRIGDRQGQANALVTVGYLAVAQGRFADADTAYADAEIAFTALSCPPNRVLVSLRQLIARHSAGTART